MAILLSKTEEQQLQRVAVRTAQEDIDCFLMDNMDYPEKRAFLSAILDAGASCDSPDEAIKRWEMQSMASGVALVIKGMREIAGERDKRIISASHHMSLDDFLRRAGAKK